MRMIKMQRLQPHIFGKKAAPKKVEPKGDQNPKNEAPKANAAPKANQFAGAAKGNKNGK